MVRIRKKTSKRGKTHQREKIKHKVTETRKKAKKEAKKNPQWKSKQKKDPGIPNNFPYKDQILAEIAEERRKEAEAKQLRKEKKKLEKNGAAAGEEEEDEKPFDGIRGLTSNAITEDSLPSSSKGKQKASKVADEAEDAPILINRDYANLSAVLEKADVILEVVDARDPLAYHSSNLIDFTKEKKKKLLTLVNKIDLSPREAVQSWAAHLRQQHTTLLFRSASSFIPAYESRQPSAIEKLSEKSNEDAFGVEGLLSALEAEAKKVSKDALTIAVVGIANTGKSSVLNSLLQKSVSPIYKLSSTVSGPSTTERPLETQLERNGIRLNFIDTPALSWSTSESSEDLRARDVLVRSRGRIDKAKDPISVVKPLIQRATTEDLMVFYNLPAFSKGDDTAFLSALARANNLIKKSGELDLDQASRIVLRDWSTDKFPRYTVPPSANASTKPSSEKKNDDDTESLYATDGATLEAASTRKDLRKGRGLIKLVPLEVETRKIALEENWDDEEESDKDEDKEMEVDEGESGSEEEDEEDDAEEDDEDEEEDEEEAPAPPPTKRKRHANPPAPAPRKKVAFDVKPKPVKQKPTAKMPLKPTPKKGRK
ncbi:hypothetical protein SCHPADRAFT_908760 [Schizopora paradoxa]|uniref:P-loop containing nucleoside triphosphate hydrolase protein n=1 Tax=Schizopora paradoxa TaxID=27342 RepID=A0A0H2R8V1_9AGAM|nr:hypothetical protein SCHPADRAFT_908760 [Schizopora paradoxa]